MTTGNPYEMACLITLIHPSRTSVPNKDHNTVIIHLYVNTYIAVNNVNTLNDTKMESTSRKYI